MPESINSKLKEQYDHDDSGGSLDTNLGDFLDSEGASGTSNNSKWRDWASGTGTSLNTRLFHKHGGSGSFMTRWKNWIAFSSTHSFNFDGSNDYLEIENNSVLEPTAELSVSAWAYMDNWSTASQSKIISNTQSGGYALAIDEANDNNISFFVYNGAYLNPNYALSNLSSGWHHICATYKNKTAKLYIDGSLVDTATNTNNTNISYGSNINLFVGAEPDASNNTSQFFNGKIDEVAVYNAELSASDVTSIYNNGKVIDLSKSTSYGTDRTGNLKLWLRCGDKAEPESTTAIARQDFYTDFDGTDDYISTNADSTLTDATYTFWAKADVTSNNKGVFGHGSQSTGAFHFNWASNQPLLYMGGTRFRYWNDNSAQDDGQWHHWAIILDADDMTGCKLYIDGVEQTASTTDNIGDYNAYTTGLEIGRSDSTNEFEGYISQFAVYHTLLDAQTISQMAKSRFTPMRDNRFSVVDFDGTNDTIQTSAHDTLADTTYTFWAKSDVTGANGGLFGHGGVTKSSFHFNYFGATGGARFFLGGNYFKKWDIDEQDDGQWHHYAIIADADSIADTKLYVDGVEKTASTTSSSGSPEAFTQSLTIGSDATNGNEWEGSIAQFAVYSDLKDSEFVSAQWSKGITADYSNDTNLSAYYKMGDDTSKAYPTIADSSSNSNDGTITNGASDDIVQQMVAGYDLGAFESSSEELNGEVISGSDWTPDSGITVSNGSLVFNTSTQFNKAIDTTAVSGKFYKTVFTISNYVSGSVKIRIGAFGEERSGNGTYTEYITSTTANVEFYAYTDGSNDFTIENISVKEVLQSEVSDTYPAIIDVNEPVLGVDQVTNGTFDTDANWSKQTGWSIGSGVASCDGTQTGNTGIVQQGTISGANLDFEVGKTYKLTFDVTTTAGAITYIEIGGTTDHTDVPASDSTATRYIQASSTNDRLTIAGNSSFVGTVDNVVVKEVSGNVGNMTNQAPDDLVYSSVLPDQSFLTGVNSAYNFIDLDGVDEYIETSDSADFDFGTGDFSISFWFNVNDIDWNWAVSRANSANSADLYRAGTNNSGKIIFRDIAGGTDIVGSTTVSINTWYHFQAIRNSGTLKLYLNGSEDASGSSGGNFNSDKGFRVGRWQSSGDYWNGQLTNVAVLNKALSSIDASAIHALGRHGNLLDSYSDNLVGYWAMSSLDAKTGLSDVGDGTIYDRSGNSNHGTATNTESADLKSSPNAEPNGYAKGDTNRSTTTP